MICKVYALMGVLATALMTTQSQSQAPAAARQTEERIVWGKTFRGLQGGISFQGGTNRFRAGDSVKLNLYWRNVSKEPVSISYAVHPGSAFRPSVFTKGGKRVPMMVDLVIAREEHRTLEAGTTISVAQAEMKIVGQLRTDDGGLIPIYALSPGRYTVDISGNEKDSSVPVSGSLEFEVVKK